MKFSSSLLVAALGVACLPASAQKAQAPSLCAAKEEPVFSCTLRGASQKMVSLCASPALENGQKSFHYLYGRPSKIELQYPASGNGDKAFTFTRLRYAGATGGYAHTFVNKGFKYIIYSVEGTGFKDAGLLVQRQGALRASSEMHCRPSTLIKLQNNDLWNDTISKWDLDPEIDAHGLPSTN
jgi:hypothetical protein